MDTLPLAVQWQSGLGPLVLLAGEDATHPISWASVSIMTTSFLSLLTFHDVRRPRQGGPNEPPEGLTGQTEIESRRSPRRV